MTGRPQVAGTAAEQLDVLVVRARLSLATGWARVSFVLPDGRRKILPYAGDGHPIFPDDSMRRGIRAMLVEQGWQHVGIVGNSPATTSRGAPQVTYLVERCASTVCTCPPPVRSMTEKVKAYRRAYALIGQ